MTRNMDHGPGTLQKQNPSHHETDTEEEHGRVRTVSQG